MTDAAAFVQQSTIPRQTTTRRNQPAAPSAEAALDEAEQYDTPDVPAMEDNAKYRGQRSNAIGGICPSFTDFKSEQQP